MAASATTVILSTALVGAAVAGYLTFEAWRTSGEGVTLRFSASTPNSAAYRLAGDIAARLDGADGFVRVQVQTTEGSAASAEQVLAGEADLAIVQTDQAVPGAMRAIAILQTEQFHLIARHGLGLRGPEDLGGLTVALPPEGSGGYRIFFAVLEHYNVPVDTLTIVSGTIPDNLAALDAGRVDALFTVRPAGGADMQAAIRAMSAAGRPPLIVPIAQAGAMRITRPWLQDGVIPRGTYVGQPPVPAQDVRTPALDTLLVARAGADPEAVYRLTRTLFEDRAALVLANPDAAAIRAPDPMTLTTLDIHPGATRYFTRDEPSLITRYYREIEFAFKAAAGVASILVALTAWFASRRRKRLDAHVAALIALEAQSRQARSVTELDAVHDRILDTIAATVAELHSGQVSDSGFQTFTLAADTVRASLAERRARLSARADAPFQPLRAADAPQTL